MEDDLQWKTTYVSCVLCVRVPGLASTGTMFLCCLLYCLHCGLLSCVLLLHNPYLGHLVPYDSCLHSTGRVAISPVYSVVIGSSHLRDGPNGPITPSFRAGGWSSCVFFITGMHCCLYRVVLILNNLLLGRQLGFLY